MADKNDKVAENTAGRYYIDSGCIACGLCINEAPGCFKMIEGEDYAYVYSQPENETEEAACAEAMGMCPVNAIGNNG